MSSEHVEVLRRMRNEWPLATDEGPALDAAIASLSAPQPPAEAQPVGEVRMYSGLLYARLDGDFPVGTKLYAHPPPSAPVGVGALEVFRLAGGDTEREPNPTPERALEVLHNLRACYEVIAQQSAPVAPVGVEGLIARWRKEAEGFDCSMSDGTGGALEACADDLEAALAQQPPADEGFTAADMMDARQEGRKEAQQPAADSPSFTAGDMADAAAQGFRDGVASVGAVGVEAREE